MDKPPSSSRLLFDRLLEMDEARNARPHEPQHESQMVQERNARLVEQAEKIAALKRAREAASGPEPQPPTGETKRAKVKSGEGDKGDRPRARRKAPVKARKKTAARKGAARKSAGKAKRR